VPWPARPCILHHTVMLHELERKAPISAKHRRAVSDRQDVSVLWVISRRSIIPASDRQDLARHTRECVLERIETMRHRF